MPESLVATLAAMTTRYRVEYALKTHRRDQLIEWIKGLLAVPFVLHSQPTAIYSERDDVLPNMASTSHRRYAEILKDVEELVNDHSMSLCHLLSMVENVSRHGMAASTHLVVRISFALWH